MKKFSLFGASMLAASLMALPAMAQQTLYNNGYNNGGGRGFGYNGNSTAFYNNAGGNGYAGHELYNNRANGGGYGYANNGNNGGGNANNGVPMAYRSLGFGGYTGFAVMPGNGNNNNNNNNGNNNQNRRISQRNGLLADNGDARISKVIGSGVWNFQNKQLGTVNDVLIGRNGVFAVIATNNKQVVVPFRDLVFGNAQVDGNDKLMLPHTTQAQLNTRPTFHYYLPNYPNYNNNNNG